MFDSSRIDTDMVDQVGQQIDRALDTSMVEILENAWRYALAYFPGYVQQYAYVHKVMTGVRFNLIRDGVIRTVKEMTDTVDPVIAARRATKLENEAWYKASAIARAKAEAEHGEGN